MSRNGPLALLYHALFLAFAAAPLVVVIFVSFTAKGFLSLPFDGVSLRWYRAILQAPEWLASLRISLALATLSASLAVATGIPAALAIARYRFRGRDALGALLLSPLMIPAIVLGVSFLRFLTLAGISGTFAGMVLCHVVVIMPYVVRLLLAALAGLDRRIEQAAASLGAGKLTVLCRVTLPLILPGIAGGWILGFVTSFDELTVTLFVASPSTTTLPVRLFNYIDQMTDPLVAAVSASLIFGTALLMILLDRFYRLDRLLVGQGRS
jgi:putative spermidine/putrescine transport system permease protein